MCSSIPISQNFQNAIISYKKPKNEITNKNMIKKKGINIKTYLLVDILYAMKINYKWLLSATPFVNPMLNYNSYVNFLSNIDSFEKQLIKLLNPKKGTTAPIDMKVLRSIYFVLLFFKNKEMFTLKCQ